MLLRPQSVVGEPSSELGAEPEALTGPTAAVGPGRVVVALFDGLPLAGHNFLAGRLEIDDPDDFSSKYGLAAEQRHGTAMASLILHGDLNDAQPPVRHRLYTRPVMFPQQLGFGPRAELFPLDSLGVDLMWEAFRRMMEGEEAHPPAAPAVPASAPSVRIVNLSLGDPTRRFAGLMSPWARLIDYLAWKYDLLILVSAGNVTDGVPLPESATWSAFENASAEERQAEMLRSVLAQRAARRLLSPSEAINPLTIGACQRRQRDAKWHAGYGDRPLRQRSSAKSKFSPWSRISPGCQTRAAVSRRSGTDEIEQYACSYRGETGRQSRPVFWD